MQASVEKDVYYKDRREFRLANSEESTGNPIFVSVLLLLLPHVFGMCKNSLVYNKLYFDNECPEQDF